jgi:hypothetical protein
MSSHVVVYTLAGRLFLQPPLRRIISNLGKMRRNEAAKSSLAALHPEFAWNGGEKWCKSAQNTPGNQPINNSE